VSSGKCEIDLGGRRCSKRRSKRRVLALFYQLWRRGHPPRNRSSIGATAFGSATARLTFRDLAFRVRDARGDCVRSLIEGEDPSRGSR
jgi:hypothetical protein